MKLKLVKKDDGYSFYENPDKDIIEAIKSMPKPTTFNYWTQEGECSIVKELPNGKLMCEDTEGDVFTLSKEEYDEAISDQHLLNINKKFSIFDFMNKHFMPIKYDTNIIKGYDSKFLMGDYEANPTGVQFTLETEEWSTYDCDRYIQVEYSYDGLSSSSIYFDVDGLIANRDYNMDFNRIDYPFITKEKHINDIISKFDKYETIIKQGKCWFATDFCYIINEYGYEDEDGSIGKFYISKREHKYDKTYYTNGQSREKKVLKPTKSETVPISDFKDELRKELNKYFKIE